MENEVMNNVVEETAEVITTEVAKKPNVKLGVGIIATVSALAGAGVTYVAGKWIVPKIKAAKAKKAAKVVDADAFNEDQNDVE